MRVNCLSPFSPRLPIRIHMPTVALAHFEDLIARGLRALIEEDESLELIGYDLDEPALRAALAGRAPDVTLLNFGSLRTPYDVHELHTSFPATRFIVLASRPTPSEANQMISFGATACLGKETQGRDVLSAIHLASRGLHVLPKARVTNLYEAAGPESLTSREADVLSLLQQGHSNAEIALALSVGIETVRTHVRNVLRKTGVDSRRELAVR